MLIKKGYWLSGCLIILCNNYVLNIYYVPGTVLGSGDNAVNKADKACAT